MRASVVGVVGDGLIVGSNPLLLEREHELARWQEHIDAALSGAGTVVLIRGEPGIGKTRLLQAARRAAETSGVRVVTARGTDFEREFPFGLVRQLFESFVTSLSERDRSQALRGPAAGAHPLVAGKRSAAEVSRTDPGFAVLNSLYWLLANLSEQTPLALIVDDAHWADLPSQRFLRFVLPRLDDLPVALILGARTQAMLVDDPLADLSSDARTTTLHLKALSSRAVARLVRTQLSADAHEMFCRACHDASAGNPFLLNELFAELQAKGTPPTAAMARYVGQVMPETIKHAVTRRLDGLGDDVRALARAAAVLGDAAPFASIAELAGLDAAAAGRALDTLTAARLVETSPLRFVHPLVRNAILADLPLVDVAATHRAAAHLLEREGAEPERVALHLLAAPSTDDPNDAATLTVAARRALSRGAPEAAVRYLRRVLMDVIDGEQRTEAFRMLVTAAYRSMDREAFDDLGDDPTELLRRDSASPPELAFELALWLSMVGRKPDATDVLDDAITRADARDDVGLALRLEAQRRLLTQPPATEGRARYERFLSRVQTGTPAERVAHALRAHWASLAAEPASATAQLALRALDGGHMFADIPDAPLPFQASFVLILAEELDRADEILTAALADARKRGSLVGTMLSSTHLARIAYLRGEIALAEEILQGTLEMSRPFGPRNVLMLRTWLIETLIERGALDDAEREVQTVMSIGAPRGGYWEMRTRYARSQLLLAQHRPAEGIDELLAVGEHLRRVGELNPAAVPWRSLAAPHLAAQGRTETARALVEEELALARRWGTPAAIGRALRARGALETAEGKLQTLADAVAMTSSSPVQLEHCRALYELGAALRRAHRREEARGPLRAVAALAGANGAVAIAQRASDELEATGETVRRSLSVGLESLTPSERRVARMAARGLTNREIADDLFLSVKTVETHLSSTFRKLDIASRVQLAPAFEAQPALNQRP